MNEAMIYLDDQGVPRSQVQLQARRAATGMAELGVAEGDCVALLLRNDFAFFEVQQAAAAIGAYAVPLNWHGKTEELLYGATLLYAVMALLPSQLGVRFHDRVAPWLVLTNALATLWLALFTAEHLGPSVLVIFALLTTSVFMYTLANEHLRSEHLNRWWRVPFALWIGWLSIATIANVSLALAAAGWNGHPLGAPVWATILLCGSAGLALGLNIAYRDPVVPLVISWGSAAIAVERWDDSTLVAVVAMLVAIKCLLWAGSTLLFQAYPIPRKYIEVAQRAARLTPRDLRRS